MRQVDFYTLIEKTVLPECLSIMKSKGDAYSGNTDKLGNFKRCASLADVPLQKAWFIYFVKHYDALCSYIKGGYNDSEPIEGRINDMINYLFILRAIIEEQKNDKKEIETGGTSITYDKVQNELR